MGYFGSVVSYSFPFDAPDPSAWQNDAEGAAPANRLAADLREAGEVAQAEKGVAGQAGAEASG